MEDYILLVDISKEFNAHRTTVRRRARELGCKQLLVHRHEFRGQATLAVTQADAERIRSEFRRRYARPAPLPTPQEGLTTGDGFYDVLVI